MSALSSTSETEVSMSPDASEDKRKFIRQMSTMGGVVVNAMAKKKAKYQSQRDTYVRHRLCNYKMTTNYFLHFSFSTYFKLFVAMGLTWSLEVLAWFLSGTDHPAPEGLIVAFNITNIFQGIIIFLVFTLKPETSRKLVKWAKGCGRINKDQMADARNSRNNSSIQTNTTRVS